MEIIQIVLLPSPLWKLLEGLSVLVRHVDAYKQRACVTRAFAVKSVSCNQAMPGRCITYTLYLTRLFGSPHSFLLTFFHCCKGPSSSFSVQADLYRPLDLPVVLVGDGKLGGISATISAFESLYMRGYRIASIVIIEPETQQLGMCYLYTPYLVLLIPSLCSVNHFGRITVTRRPTLISTCIPT